MGWTGLESDQNDAAMDSIMDLQNTVMGLMTVRVRPTIEHILEGMREKYEEEDISDFWGLLVAAHKAFPNVFSTGLLSPALRSYAEEAFNHACSNKILSQFNDEDRKNRRQVLKREKSALLRCKRTRGNGGRGRGGLPSQPRGRQTRRGKMR